jgi:hypothetical protein
MVDLEEDCLRQYKKKGYVEVGVDFTDGVKTILSLAIRHACMVRKLQVIDPWRK